MILVFGFAAVISHLQLIRLHERSAIHTVPIRDGLIVLGGLILSAVFQPDEGVFSKGHQIAEQEPVGRFDLVLLILCFFGVARAGRMAGKGPAHILAVPIISSAAPFLRAGALGLPSLVVIKESARFRFAGV